MDKFVLGHKGNMFVIANPDMVYVTNVSTGESYKAIIDSPRNIPYVLDFPVKFHKDNGSDFGYVTDIDEDTLYGREPKDITP
jgi:hypothetical protein